MPNLTCTTRSKNFHYELARELHWHVFICLAGHPGGKGFQRHQHHRRFLYCQRHKIVSRKRMFLDWRPEQRERPNQLVDSPQCYLTMLMQVSLATQVSCGALSPMAVMNGLGQKYKNEANLKSCIITTANATTTNAYQLLIYGGLLGDAICMKDGTDYCMIKMMETNLTQVTWGRR